jgi:hypothetical protein
MRYGVLKICKHDLPCSHNPPSFPPVWESDFPFSTPNPGSLEPAALSVDQMWPWCSPLGSGYENGVWSKQWEPLSTWRHFSRQASALTKIADRLLRGQVANPGDWATVYERSRGPAPSWVDERINPGLVRAEGQLLARVVNEWFTIGNVRPVLTWPSDTRPSVRLGGPVWYSGMAWVSEAGLFGALAVQLALAVGQSRGFAICDHCRSEYVPERRPRIGQRRFCQECRVAGIPNRYSLDDFRKKLRNAKSGLTTK